MYNGIGLQTARGSGTNGYVQSNRFFVRPKTNKVLTDPSKGFDSGLGTAGMTRKPNQEILDHDRKRQIELKLLVLEDKLTDQGYTEAEISEKLDVARKLLEIEDGECNAFAPEKASETRTHQIAALKERQTETLKAALGIESDAEREKKFRDMEALGVEENIDEDELRNIHKKDDRRKAVKKSRGETKHHTKENRKKVGRVAESTDDSDTAGRKRRKKSSKKQKKAAQHDSSSSGSESQSESDSDSGSESEPDKNYKNVRSGRSPKSGEQKLHKNLKSKRHDSDDDSSKGGRRRESKKPNNRKQSSYDKYSSDDDHKQREKAKQAQNRKEMNSGDDYTSDEGPKNNSQRDKATSKGQRHDVIERNIDHDWTRDRVEVVKSLGKSSRISNGDDSGDDDGRRKGDDDIRRYRHHDQKGDGVEGLKSLGKSSRSGNVGDSGARGGQRNYPREIDDGEKRKNKVDGLGTFKKLEQLFKSKIDGSGERAEDATRDKRKIEDDRWDGQQPEQKYRKRDPTKETRHEGTNVSSERQSKSHKHVEDNGKDSRLTRTSGGDHEDKSLGIRNESRNGDMRVDRDHEGYGRSERERRDEKEERRGRKHERLGHEDAYKRDREHQGGGRGREKEDEREGEYASKRARYDEVRSSGRRYDDDNKDGDRHSRRR